MWGGGEQVKRSVEQLVKRRTKGGARVTYRGLEMACSCGFSLSIGSVIMYRYFEIANGPMLWQA